MISACECDTLREIRSAIRDVLLSANPGEVTYNPWHDSNPGLSSTEVRTIASAILAIDLLTGDETKIWSDLSTRKRARV
ncbi:MAG: hypothetical protein EOM93_05305 [Gammaproteobacteria bacterium]|nr:hypothetical protein [Gammaproteobacteria bacterium]